MSSGGANKGGTKYREAASDELLESGERGINELAAASGLSVVRTRYVVDRMSEVFPIYETGKGRWLKYGMLKQGGM